MYFAAFLSKIAIYLGIWACFATSENMGLVRIAPWSSGKVPLYQFLGGSNSTTYKIVQAKLGKNFDENAKVKMYIGLNGVVVDATDAAQRTQLVQHEPTALPAESMARSMMG